MSAGNLYLRLDIFTSNFGLLVMNTVPGRNYNDLPCSIGDDQPLNCMAPGTPYGYITEVVGCMSGPCASGYSAKLSTPVIYQLYLLNAVSSYRDREMFSHRMEIFFGSL